MILAEGSLEEAELRLQGHGRVFVHAIGGLRSSRLAREVCDGHVDILDHVLEHRLAGITREVQVFVGRADLMVDPRNVTELADHVGIIECAPELRQGRIFFHGLFILAVVDVGQQGVHLAQVGKRPAARCRNGTIVSASDQVGRVHLHEDVTFHAERLLLKKVVIERVGEELQVFRRPEIGFRGKLGLGNQRELIVQIA